MSKGYELNKATNKCSVNIVGFDKIHDEEDKWRQSWVPLAGVSASQMKNSVPIETVHICMLLKVCNVH